MSTITDEMVERAAMAIARAVMLGDGDEVFKDAARAALEAVQPEPLESTALRVLGDEDVSLALYHDAEGWHAQGWKVTMDEAWPVEIYGHGASISEAIGAAAKGAAE